jgi:phosphopantetheinyl transferase (holo-ACP synthase)
MLGNDVVDIGELDSLLHERFDARVFGAAERGAIAASSEPSRMRWVLWAAKESAFKALRRLDRSVTFRPLRFSVTSDLEPHDRGTWMHVAHERNDVCVRIENGASFLHAVAHLDAGAAATTLSAVARAEEIAPGATLREAVRKLARDGIAQALSLNASELEVAREARIPHLAWRGATLPGALSLSHDGRFVAFACQIAQTAAGGLS